ncbi:MAG: lipase, partial [Clostridia bacterium]|nr:lipase [Clostridia bacterium]
SYLDDALFIGDSRTVGLQSYTDISNADFFSTVGMSVFKVFTEKAKVDGTLTDLTTLLKSKNYGKVYIMLGINELGYNRQTAFGKYKALVNEIRKLQPDAYIFIQGNIHVGAERSSTDEIINNKGINEYNALLESLQNEKDIFYIDVEKVFDDANGNLSTNYSSDGIHLFPKDYKLWKDYILTKTIK